jgi:hypothetical protein
MHVYPIKFLTGSLSGKLPCDALKGNFEYLIDAYEFPAITFKAIFKTPKYLQNLAAPFKNLSVLTIL